MLLAQISSWIYEATRARLSPEQIVIIMDNVQRLAFARDAYSFLNLDKVLEVWHNLSFAAGGYTDPVDADIGKTVIGTVSGAFATLRQFDNTTRQWQVRRINDIDFQDGEFINIATGTGNGTLDASESFSIYRGPYFIAPTDPPARKIWGVSKETLQRIFGVEDPAATPMDDFGFNSMVFNPKNVFEPGLIDNLELTFTFVLDPSETQPYRWVYWRLPPTITGTADETQLLIPSTYHQAFANACVKQAQLALAGEDIKPEEIDQFFKPWWDSMIRPYIARGKSATQTLNPQDPSWTIL